MASEKHEARSKELRDTLEQSIKTLQESRGWQDYLRQASRFHKYSFGNTMLIYAQCEDASYVAGFKAWINLGRCVRKGESAIWIIAPRPWTRERDGEEESGISFGTAAVFDISQTDPVEGHPHPFQLPVMPDAAGDPDVCETLYEGLRAFAADQGWKLDERAEERDTLKSGTRGYWSPMTKTIWIDPDLSIVERVATFIHEAAHGLTSAMIREQGGGADVREIVAESVAFMVCDRYGIESLDRSTFYIATWMDNPNDFKAVMNATTNAAHQLLDALDATIAAGVEREEVAA